MYAAPEVMVFQPTRDEFQDFNKYIEYIESKGANKAGLAKVIPPAGWVPRQKSYVDDDVMDMIISNPVRQSAILNTQFGVFNQYNQPVKPMSVKEYRIMAESKKYNTPIYNDFHDLERKYWRNITYNSPIYGAGVSRTLFDVNVNEWNVSNPKTILDYLRDVDGIIIEGVNTPYLYIGMWKTMFPWHTEDMDLYSFSYLHEGEPKTWYSIPPEHGHRFEDLAAKLFPDQAKMCSSFLRHKTTVISPQVLNRHSIPFNTTTQNKGEFIISLPFTYHSGFNHGFNMAEAINFASPRWIDYGKRAAQCFCQGIGVNFSMNTFVQHEETEK